MTAADERLANTGEICAATTNVPSRAVSASSPAGDPQAAPGRGRHRAAPKPRRTLRAVLAGFLSSLPSLTGAEQARTYDPLANSLPGSLPVPVPVVVREAGLLLAAEKANALDYCGTCQSLHIPLVPGATSCEPPGPCLDCDAPAGGRHLATCESYGVLAGGVA